MATHLGSPQFHSRTIRYFFFLSLYVVSILAPIASSMAFTSAACAPSGASSKYFFRASAVPGGTVYLFCASNLPLPYMDDPLMKYASALLGSAAMALSQATDAPSMLPVLYWVAQMLKYAVPGLGDNSAALLKASIASGFFFSLRYALPSLVSICAAAALALAGSALGSLPFWAKGTAFPNVARASSYFPRFNCAFPSACRYSQRVGLMVESCCSKGSVTCQFFACNAGLSCTFLPESVWVRMTWAPANGVEPSVTFPVTLASTACEHAGMTASANSRAATAAKIDFLFIIVKPSGFNSQKTKPCDSPHAPC